MDFDTGERLIVRFQVIPQQPLDPLTEEHFDRLGHAYAERAVKAETERLHAHPIGVKSRDALLRSEVPRLYNAFSYFNHSRGLTMNTFLTVSYEALGVYDHREAMKLHGKLNDKLQNWLAVGLVPKVAGRRRLSARAQIQSSEHFYGYVSENARDMRFHVHQLMWVPAVTQQLGDHGRHIYKATLMVHEARRWLAKQVGSRTIPFEAIKMTFHAPRSVDEDLRWQWDRFRYMAKSLSPTVVYSDGNGGWVNGRELFKPDPFKAMRPVFSPQLAGGSHNIWKKTQKEAGFVSMFDAFEDTELYSDWALRAFKERIEAEQRAAEFDELLESLTV